jgi:hypothetical protein
MEQEEEHNCRYKLRGKEEGEEEGSCSQQQLLKMNSR